MNRRHQRPTLFPYTTLFRSVIVAVPVATAVTSPLPFTIATAVLLLAQVTARPLSGVPFASFGDLGDRKSTRLNSSHRCISYAVFCVKKQNKTDHCALARICH